jgi:hypothetical protein
MKRKALEKAYPKMISLALLSCNQNHDLLSWLQNL